MIGYEATVISPRVKVRVERTLPQEGEVVVRQNQEVAPVQVIARASNETTFSILDAGSRLNLSQDELLEQLDIAVGDTVELGQPLLKRGRFFNRRQLYSPVDGFLYKVQNGRFIFRETLDWIEIRAMVRGKILNHISSRGAVIEVNCAYAQAVWGNEGEAFGPLKVIADSANATFAAALSDLDIEGHIVVTGYIDDIATMRQLEKDGAAGLIVGSLTADIFDQLDTFLMPTLLTDGVGTVGMSAPIYELLTAANEQECSVFARHSDKMGRRPEIIIPVERPATEFTPFPGPLQVGQKVRVLRAPYQNKFGEIVQLYKQPQRTALNTKAEGANILLEDGNTLFVPYTNLDVIL